MKCQVTGRNSCCRFLGNRKACREFFQSQLKKDNPDRSILCLVAYLGVNNLNRVPIIGEEMSRKTQDQEVDVNRLLGALLVPQTPPNR